MRNVATLCLSPSFNISRSFHPTAESASCGTQAGVGVEGGAGSSSDVLVEKQKKELTEAKLQAANHPKGTSVQRALIKGVRAVCMVLIHKQVWYLHTCYLSISRYTSVYLCGDHSRDPR